MVTISAEIERLIESRIASGRYASADDVLSAALRSLEQAEMRGDFGAGEWEALLEQGETGGDDLDGEAVLTELRVLRQAPCNKG